MYTFIVGLIKVLVKLGYSILLLLLLLYYYYYNYRGGVISYVASVTSKIIHTRGYSIHIRKNIVKNLKSLILPLNHLNFKIETFQQVVINANKSNKK